MSCSSGNSSPRINIAPQRKYSQDSCDCEEDHNFSPQLQVQQQKKKKYQNISYNEQQAQELEEKTAEEQFVENPNKENQQIDVDAKLMETLERIHLNVVPRSDVAFLTQFPQMMPVILQVQSVRQQQSNAKANIDLVCVVDVSGSMEGKKIKLVMDSLRYIQKILSPGDRLSIVTFGTHAQINLPWTRNIHDNKKKIKNAIKGMQIRDSTNIAGGVNLGLRMIKNRKHKNPVTCMFVLSDGQDDNNGADIRVSASLQEYNIQDSFVINTFGYGADHDAKVMNSIATAKGGNFVFIENIQKASEHFILSMSGMLSVLAKNVKLQVEENPNYRISKVYGDDFLWKKNELGVYEMTINYLVGSDSKEFALLIELPTNEKVNLQQDVILRVRLNGELIELKQNFQKQVDLQMKFSLQEVQYQPKELVEVNYLRAKSGDVIGEAKELARQKKYDQAQQLLRQLVDEIELSQFKTVKQLTLLLTDLQQVKQICLPKVFEQKGEALMLNKQRNHIQRQRSINNSEEWNSDEEEQMNNFQQGKICLSCSDNESDEEDNPPQKQQQLKKRKDSRQNSDSDSN